MTVSPPTAISAIDNSAAPVLAFCVVAPGLIADRMPSARPSQVPRPSPAAAATVPIGCTAPQTIPSSHRGSSQRPASQTLLAPTRILDRRISGPVRGVARSGSHVFLSRSIVIRPARFATTPIIGNTPSMNVTPRTSRLNWSLASWVPAGEAPSPQCSRKA